MRIGDIPRDLRDVTCYIGGQRFAFTYDADLCTQRVWDEVREDCSDEEAVAYFLARVVAAWSLTDDRGVPIPPSHSPALRLPSSFNLALLRAMVQDRCGMPDCIRSMEGV